MEFMRGERWEKIDAPKPRAGSCLPAYLLRERTGDLLGMGGSIYSC